MKVRIVYTLTYPVDALGRWDPSDGIDAAAVLAANAADWHHHVIYSISCPLAGDERSVRVDLVGEGDLIIATAHPKVG
jgi:hypothetical protein